LTRTLPQHIVGDKPKGGNKLQEETNGVEHGTFLFHHLITMFATLAYQQLGKLVNPITAKMERDLRQARITIDMLEMIRDKTSGNLTDEEERLLDSILMELQMNYVDETNRGVDECSEEPQAGTSDDTPKEETS
jgi:hypothetical protein